MYVVNERIVLNLPGKTVTLAPGPRGVKEIRKGPDKPVIDTVDEDAALRATVPADVLEQLIADGKITEQA